MNEGARRGGALDLLDALQLALLVAFSVLVLWTAPQHWRYTPDSGIYVGTAESLVTTWRYTFNGHPNLLYYPGFPAVLALPIAIFGVDFKILHLLTAATGVACVWLTRSLFPRSRYGLAGLAAPLALAAAQPLLVNTFAVLSDGLFLALVLAAALAWRRFEEGGAARAGLACGGFVAFAALVRFEGLVVVGAFGAALLFRELRRGTRPAPAGARAAALASLALLPFALWTLRNWGLHTPDTFNMGNRFFFGLEGLALYAPGRGILPGVDSPAVYFVLRLLRTVSRLLEALTGLATYPTSRQLVLVFSGVGLAAAGARRWLRGASLFERGFVAAFLAFQVYSQWAAGSSIYVVTRYWIPFLPFLLLAWGLGVQALGARFVPKRAAALVPIAGCALLGLLGWNAARVVEGVWGRAEFYANASRVRADLREFAQARIPADARVATTDWGVIPFTLGRESYQILDDADHQLTLQRMAHYGTGYLVVLTHLTRFANRALELTETEAQIFRRLERIEPDGPGPTAIVYAVHPERLRWRAARTRGGAER